MSRMVQIRNVPDTLHRKLKVTRAEMLARIHGRKRVTLKTPAAAVIREARESA